MALPIHSSCYSHHHLHSQLTTPKLSIKSQQDTPTTSSSNEPSSKKPTSPGLGFGSPPPSPKPVSKKQNKREVIRRRDPIGKPGLGLVQEDSSKVNEQLGQNESAFVLTWLGLGGVILVQGILLAASGFLPEEWDKFFVKFLYPYFTPTVGLFVAGSVAYGVLKYLQNEELKD